MDVLGYRPDEMIGRTGTDFIHPDDLDNTRNEMRAARRGKAMRNFVCRYVHKDGHAVTLTWTGQWSDPVQKHFFSGRDMSGQMRAEEGLLDSERVARGIIDTALDAFAQMDGRGVIVDWNRQAQSIFGWSREEAVGRELAELIAPGQDAAGGAQGIERFLATGESSILGKRRIIEARRHDGKEIKIELSVTSLQRRNGCANRRRWRRSASSPAASRTTSTTSSPSSRARSKSSRRASPTTRASPRSPT
jgi:PAS domain S-box-containing protein